MSVVDENVAYFAGDDSLLLKTEDGGTGFTRIDFAFDGEDLDGGIAFISATLGIVAIDNYKDPKAFYTHDGGDNWVKVPIVFPPGTTSQRFYDVASTSDSTFAIAAWGYCVFISHDGGKSYTQIGNVNYGSTRFQTIAMIDESTIFAAGSNGHMEKTVDGGSSWDTLYTGNGQTANFINFADADKGYIFSSSAHWMKTADGGQSWLPLNEWPSMSFWGLALPEDDKILVTGWGGGELTVSTDGGQNWTYPDNYETLSPTNLYECEFSDANHGLIGGGSGTIRITDDGGTTWTFVDNPMYQASNKHINSLRYMNADTVFAGGSSGYIIRSIDGGQTWQQMKNNDTQTVYDIWPISSTQIMLSSGSGRFCLSNATLDTFNLVSDYGSMSMRAVEFRGAVGIVPASKGYIYRTTTDALDTLIEVFVDPDGDDLYDVEFVEDSLAYIVGEKGKIYKSEDAGQTWTAETSPTDQILQKVRYRNNIVWAVGKKGTILKLDLTPNSIDGGEWQIVDAYELSQNYPNPFNPSTTISFTLQKAGSVELTVYNIQGQKVAMLVNKKMKAGSNTVVWDASHLASGVYYYKLTSGDYTAVKKMTLIK